MRKQSLLNALMPATRQGILAAALLDPSRSWSLSELARHLGVRPSSLQRELASLTEAEILLRERRGNRITYRANPDCPLYPELRGLVIKTAGLGDVIRAALAEHADRIRVAFIYGSIARAEARAISDIDLMVIGRLGLAELAPTLRPAEKRLGRPINPTIYSPEEFAEKLASRHHFLSTVMSEPKLWLLGDDRDLAVASGQPPHPAASDEFSRT